MAQISDSGLQGEVTVPGKETDEVVTPRGRETKGDRTKYDVGSVERSKYYTGLTLFDMLKS